MQTKKATVKRITHNVRQWNSPSGTLYYHTIEFENGDKGDYGSKSEQCVKFEEGKESDYTIETKQIGNYTNIIIKPLQEDKPFNKKQIGSEESFSLSYAKDLACAYIASGKEFKSNQIIEVAEVFYNWLKSKK